MITSDIFRKSINHDKLIAVQFMILNVSQPSCLFELVVDWMHRYHIYFWHNISRGTYLEVNGQLRMPLIRASPHLFVEEWVMNKQEFKKHDFK